MYLLSVRSKKGIISQGYVSGSLKKIECHFNKQAKCTHNRNTETFRFHFKSGFLQKSRKLTSLIIVVILVVEIVTCSSRSCKKRILILQSKSHVNFALKVRNFF